MKVVSTHYEVARAASKSWSVTRYETVQGHGGGAGARITVLNTGIPRHVAEHLKRGYEQHGVDEITRYEPRWP